MRHVDARREHVLELDQLAERAVVHERDARATTSSTKRNFVAIVNSTPAAVAAAIIDCAASTLIASGFSQSTGDAGADRGQRDLGMGVRRRAHDDRVDPARREQRRRVRICDASDRVGQVARGAWRSTSATATIAASAIPAKTST